VPLKNEVRRFSFLHAFFAEKISDITIYLYINSYFVSQKL